MSLHTTHLLHWAPDTHNSVEGLFFAWSLYTAQKKINEHFKNTWNFTAATQMLLSLYSLMCLYACLTMLGLTMRLWMLRWGISSQIWVRASLSSRTVWGATWQQMDQNILDLDQTRIWASECNKFLHTTGIACILLQHEDEHCHVPGETRDPLQIRLFYGKFQLGSMVPGNKHRAH